MFYLLRLTDQSYSEVGHYETLELAMEHYQPGDIIERRQGHLTVIVVS